MTLLKIKQQHVTGLVELGDPMKIKELLESVERKRIIAEFAPDRSDDGDGDWFDEEALRRLAAQWFNADEDPRVEQILAAAGWEIGWDEGYDDEPGVFVVMSGDEHGRTYMNWAAEDLRQANDNIPDLRRVGETISSADEAERRFSNGDRIFAFHEMDDEPHEVTSIEELNRYAPDRLLAVKRTMTEWDEGIRSNNPQGIPEAQEQVKEVAAPGQEEWIMKNKKRFHDQYGKERGTAILYATAWKRAKGKK